MGIPFVDLKSQYRSLQEDVERVVLTELEQASYVLGDSVEAFEEAFASFCGVKHAIGVANGTDALTISLKALGVGEGDEVITAVNSFLATAEAIKHTGATPVFVDITNNSYNLNPSSLNHALTQHTAAIVPVHLYGQVAGMDDIRQFAEAHGLLVVEDAAQAHGARLDSSIAGSLGNIASFSFYPAKNLGAFGDAGAIATNDNDLARQSRKLRNHGGIRKYEHDIVGFNSRLDTLQAAVLNVKLPYLDEWNAARRRNAKLYNELLAEIPGITTPTEQEDSTHVYHLYVIRVEDGRRDELKAHLGSRGIGTGIHYPTPIHLTKAFQYLGYREGDFPVTEDYAGKILSLPMFPELDRSSIEYVAHEVHSFMTNGS